MTAIARTGQDALKIIEIRKPDLLIVGDRDSVPDVEELRRHLRERFSTVNVMRCASISEGDGTLALQHLSHQRQLTPSSGDAACWIADIRGTLRAFAGGQGIAGTQSEERSVGGDPLASSTQKLLTPKSAETTRFAGKQSRKATAWVPRTLPRVLTIGCSTGGPAALTEILPLIPANFALPVLIVQHMPPLFTGLLADRLARSTQIPVMEAVNGMEVKPGVILIAPGNFHMKTVRKKAHVEIELTREPHENSCRPAVDVRFRSIAEAYNGRRSRCADGHGARRVARRACAERGRCRHRCAGPRDQRRLGYAGRDC